MKIGILREERIPFDNRVPLSPKQCKELVFRYRALEIVVARSSQRCFDNESYIREGISIVDDISDCDILLGIKQVPIDKLIPKKIYFFFSHTIKKQVQNRKLLQELVKLSITMVDYECLHDVHGKRILGFGRYAGIVGAYNGLLAYGLKSRRYLLKPPNKCADKEELEHELNKVNLTNEKIVITGNRRVSNGVLEVLRSIRIKQVSPQEFLDNTNSTTVFTQLNAMDFNIRKDNQLSNKQEFYNSPKFYQSCFMNFAKRADIFIAGHYYKTGSPLLLTKEDIRSVDFNIKVIADISCDLNGPISSTIRSSTISEPIYGYNPETNAEDDFMKDDVIGVMAIDNLPSSLPKDSSIDFGNELIKKVFPLIFEKDINDIIKNATICAEGRLTKNFIFLKSFVAKD